MDSNLCNYREAKHILKKAFSIKKPVMIWGPPGIGKSDLINEIGMETGRDVIDIRLLLVEPTDLKGYPYYDSKTNSMKWSPPSELPNDDAILFFDELSAAPPTTQAATYQLILDRKIGEYTLPSTVDIVAAGNRTTDNGVSYKMPSPLANRMIHITMKSSYEDWENWAIKNNINKYVLSFLSSHKEFLFDESYSSRSNEVAFRTPRSWAICSDILDGEKLNDGKFSRYIEKTVAGAIGETSASAFFSYVKEFSLSEIPTPQDIYEGVGHLKQNDATAAVCNSILVSCIHDIKNTEDPTLSMKKINSVLKFTMEYMDDEYSILFTSLLRKADIIVRYRELEVYSHFKEKFNTVFEG